MSANRYLRLDKPCHHASVTASEYAADEDFFRWVEEYVTPAMQAHGYEVCSAGVGRATDDDLALRRTPSGNGWGRFPLLRRPRQAARRRLKRQLAVGYEGDSGNEYWVY